MSRTRLEFAAAVLLGLIGAGSVLAAAGRVWARGIAAGVVAEFPVSVTGRDLVPVLSGLGLLALAGSVVVIAARRLGRVALGVAMTTAGAWAAAAALAANAGPEPALREAAGRVTGRSAATVTAVTTSAWPWLAAGGGFLVLLSGLAIAVRGTRWPAMSSRYERTAPAGPADSWRALDRGEDPTL